MSTKKFVYHMENVSKIYPGGKKCFENIHLSFLPGVKIGVVGVNGSGKSSLMKIMAGIDKDFVGEAWGAKNITVGYLPQEPKLDESKNVRENILISISKKKQILDDFNSIATSLGEEYTEEKMEQMTELQDKIDSGNLWELDNRVDIAMEALRCPPDKEKVFNLSGGEKRRVAICMLLLEEPDLLLLDEPTNHLDAETVLWLQNHLVSYKGTCLIVTHDRYFLDSITSWILELDRGQGIPYEGNYTKWLEQKAIRMEKEVKDEKSKQKILNSELEWIKQGSKARQVKQKARIKSYHTLLQENSYLKTSESQIIIPNGPRLGSKVVEIKELSKKYDDKILIDDLNFNLPAGGIVGIIGPNGVGKTTLFNMIIKKEKPDKGQIIIGESVKLSYVDQTRDTLDDNKTVWEEISENSEILKLGDREINSRAYCSNFNFKGSDQQKKIKSLSGGERNRVHMAKLLKSGGNVILLDEPTNDLDVETLRNLENAIINFLGCVLIISHDRFFLDRLCTHILAFEGNSKVEWFEGNFEDYENDRKRRAGHDFGIPKRVKYKKFSR